MEEDGIIENHNLRANFRVTFQSGISRLEKGEPLVSKTFVFHDIPWNIRLEANRNPLFWPKTTCHLCCLETKPGFSCKISYKFLLFKPLYGLSGITMEQHDTITFDENVRSGGIVCFILSKTLSHEELILDVELKTELPPTLEADPKEKLIKLFQPSATNDLVQDLDALLDSGDGDVIFKLKDGAIVKAHKNILCVRNAVFAAMLSVDMKEANTKEVTMEDMGWRALKILLRHIYTGQLSLFEGLDVYICKEVVNAAEKYNLPELKEVAGVALAGFRSETNALLLIKFCRARNVNEGTKLLANYVKEILDEILGKLEL